MFRLLRTMDGSKYSRRVYVVAATDQLSSSKANEFEASIHGTMGGAAPMRSSSELIVDEWLSTTGGSYSIVVIPRSREVGQSYWTSIFTTLYACAASLRVVFATAPDVVRAAPIDSIRSIQDGPDDLALAATDSFDMHRSSPMDPELLFLSAWLQCSPRSVLLLLLRSLSHMLTLDLETTNAHTTVCRLEGH